MLFNSAEFLVFFFLVSVSYFFLAHRYRWILLLITSYYFYMCWRPEYLFLIVISTLIDYVAGIQIGRFDDRRKRKKYLLFSIIANFCLLFTFKYFNFFNSSLRNIFIHYNLSYNIPQLNVLLPVGISFYTFQTLSYTFDVYQGVRKPEKHLGIFSLYVAFFPQLVAGPIERSTRLLPQFFKKNNFEYRRVTDGLILVLWGFFQKVVIADRLALIVDSVYGAPRSYSGIALLFATYAFAFQIYCDFSGYTDIARGTAQILGYDLMRNFQQPYFADSVRDFWRRWHVSLTSWFKDYLYIPMGGNRVVKWHWYYNIIVVFLLSGLWHGASWNFIFWGLLHGFYFLFSYWTKTVRDKIAQFFQLDKVPIIHRYLKVFTCFHLVVISWVFFRAHAISDGFYIIKRMAYDLGAIFSGTSKVNLLGEFIFAGFSLKELLISTGVIMILLYVDVFEQKKDFRNVLSIKPLWFRWGIYLFLTLAVMNLGVSENIPFIYFQF